LEVWLTIPGRDCAFFGSLVDNSWRDCSFLEVWLTIPGRDCALLVVEV